MIKYRWQRLINHRMTANHPATMSWRIVETTFLLADMLFLPETLMLLNRIFKPNTRRLTPREIALARSIFGETIDYQKVRVDERSFIGCRQFRFAYVGFHFVNCWGKLSDAHFIHEMVHVWQYQRLGSVYIPRALWAQRTAEGYNYGGVEALEKALERHEAPRASIASAFLSFNYEQQGDIVADYFCLKNGLKPRWCAANNAYLPVFEALILPTFDS